MKHHESPGLLRRIVMTLGGALKRVILGKSTHEYLRQFTGSEEYWDRTQAAQLGWQEAVGPGDAPVVRLVGLRQDGDWS